MWPSTTQLHSNLQVCFNKSGVCKDNLDKCSEEQILYIPIAMQTIEYTQLVFILWASFSILSCIPCPNQDTALVYYASGKYVSFYLSP